MPSINKRVGTSSATNKASKKLKVSGPTWLSAFAEQCNGYCAADLTTAERCALASWGQASSTNTDQADELDHRDESLTLLVCDEQEREEAKQEADEEIEAKQSLEELEVGKTPVTRGGEVMRQLVQATASHLDAIRQFGERHGEACREALVVGGRQQGRALYRLEGGHIKRTFAWRSNIPSTMMEVDERTGCQWWLVVVGWSCVVDERWGEVCGEVLARGDGVGLRELLFRGLAMAEVRSPGLYVMSPTTAGASKRDEVMPIYIGMSMKPATRFKGHSAKPVNRRVGKVAKTHPVAMWATAVWFEDDAACPMPTTARNVLEHFAIALFRANDEGKDGLNVNSVDGVSVETVYPTKGIRLAATVLDRVVQRCRLPLHRDESAWAQIIARLMPQTDGSPHTFVCLLKGMHPDRPDVLRGLDPDSAHLRAYWAAEDHHLHRGADVTSSIAGIVAGKGRPASEGYGGSSSRLPSFHPRRRPGALDELLCILEEEIEEVPV